ncbi:MAG TPA: hypothetical protein DDX98_10615, partial [Bacteroidales bacterium]|nr:hypothetical protein [Bacteroidales bacterium]
MKNNKVVFISGNPFLSAYSGTLYLIQELLNRNINVRTFVIGHSHEKNNYKSLNINVVVLVNPFNALKLFRKVFSFIIKLRLLIVILMHKNVIISEGHWLKLAHIARTIFPKKKIIHFCQELWLTEDHSWSKQAIAFNKYSNVPNIVIDVNKERALFRKQRFSLKKVPYVLLNTVPK